MVREIISNQILWATLYSWVIAQTIKIFLNLIQGKKFKFSWIITTGGMPSAHAASVATLATYIGFQEGFQSGIFALAVIIALIAMFDAQTWRRSIGIQARILNNIMEDLYKGKRVEETRLRELIGHTPIEVFTGALLGVLVALFFISKRS